MKFFNKKLLIIIIALLTSFNTYTITTESIVATVENLISSISTSTSSSISTSTTTPTTEFAMEPYQYTIQTNDGLIHIEGFRNIEMGYDQQSATYEPYFLNDYNKTDATSTSNLETPSEINSEQDINVQSLSNNIDVSDISNISNTPQEHDYVSDKLKNETDWKDQHSKDWNNHCQQETEYNHESKTYIQQNTHATQQQKIRRTLEKIKTTHDLANKLSLPIVEKYLKQLRYDTAAKYENKHTISFREKPLPAIAQAELRFLDALISGEVTQLLKQMQNSNLSVAEAAFAKLKKLWPWKRDHTFLTSSFVNGTSENSFITLLGIDIMKFAEKDLISRSDYVIEHADAQSLKIIQEFREKCIALQQKGGLSALSKEELRLRHELFENAKNDNLTTNICYAIAEKTYSDITTSILYAIIHAPSLKKSCINLKNLELQLLTQAQQRNIVNVNQMRTWIIEHYGFDIIDAAQNCYTSRPDYVYAPENQSYLSDAIKPVFRNIESKDLQGAHTELVHLEKQLTKGFKDQNITNSTAQEEYMVKYFGTNVLETAHKTYEARADHKKLAESFMAIDVNQVAIKILENNNSYESIANEMNDLAKHIFGNARLCNLSNLPKIESHVYNSIDAIRTAQDHPTFIFNFSMVNRTLGDIQQIAHAILSGKHPVLERSSELLIKGFDTFFKGLNPFKQVSNMGHLACDLGSLLKKGGSALWNDPITTVHNGIATTFTLTELIRNTADFTSDLTVGKLYLSPEEYKQRIDAFCAVMEPLQGVTGDQCAVFIGQFMADVMFFKGLGSAYNFLKEIDVLEKLGESAVAVSRIFKKGFDTHLANNPIVITAEGITIKISDAMHTINNSGGGKNIINSSKSLLESVYAKIAPELEPEIAAIKKTYDRTKDGFAEFSHIKVTMECKHILGMELDLSKKGKLTIGGFHHDLKNVIEKSDILSFTNRVSYEHGFYKAALFDKGNFVKNVTFFPAEWPRDKVINKIYEAYDNFIKNGAIGYIEKGNKYIIRGKIQEGIEIEMYITKNGNIVTAYPILERL